MKHINWDWDGHRLKDLNACVDWKRTAMQTVQTGQSVFVSLKRFSKDVQLFS